MSAPAAGTPLRISLLGGLELHRGDTPVVLPASRRTRALLAYLVATGVPQSRAGLCDLLWDGPDDPRAALRWSLTRLRAVIDEAGAPRLVADRERVGFVARGAMIDTQQALALVGAGTASASTDTLEQAATLLRGEFLDGLELPACYRFHHWCMAERERYGLLRRAVLQALLERLEADPARALPHARAMLDADPLAETAHAALLRLLGRLGRYPEAEAHWSYARDLLRREMSIADGGPLDDAIRHVRRERLAASSVPSPARAPAADTAHAVAARHDPACEPAGNGRRGSDEPALIGREREKLVIERALAAAGPDAQAMLLFVGEPGIGKSRLLDHLAQRAAAAGRRVLRGRCYEAEMVRPYGVWIDALREVAVDDAPSALRGGVAPLLGSGVAVAVEAGREQLFESAAALVDALAATRPLVIVLDDLQWLDEASAALLHTLARDAHAGRKVLYAGAARVGEADENRWTARLLQSLQRAGRLERHALAPLGAAELAALVAGTAAAADIDGTLRASGGNPLYALQLARVGPPDASASEHGLGPPSGEQRRLDELIGAQLAALDDVDRDLLGWAAASGRELRPDLIADAAGWAPAELLRRLDRLERRGLLKSIGDGRLDFAHDLVRQAVYRSLSQSRRRAMHHQLARALTAASANEPRLAGEVAHHASLAGDLLNAVRAALAAGEHCLRVYANAEAVAVAERALAQASGLPAGPERVRLEIALLKLRIVAEASPAARRLPALVEQIEAAVTSADALALHAEAASGLHILSWLHQQANDIERARNATLAAERYTRKADAATRCQQLANTGRCLIEVETDAPRGHALIAQASALAAELQIEPIELAWGRALVARAAGDLTAARRDLERAVRLAEVREDHWREFECRVWLATVELEREAFDAVQAHCAAVSVVARRMGDPQAPFAEGLCALAHWRRRATAHARDAVEAALQALRRADDKAHLAYVLNGAAALARERGDHAAARRWAEEALAAALAVRRATEITVARATLAVLDAAHGDVEAAVRRLGMPAHDECAPTFRARTALEHARAAIAAVGALPAKGESA